VGTRSTWEGYGIVNQYGDPWSYDIFTSAKDAEMHIASEMTSEPRLDLSQHRVVKMKVTAEVTDPD
jgi:hypothetical protein